MSQIDNIKMDFKRVYDHTSRELHPGRVFIMKKESSFGVYQS